MIGPGICVRTEKRPLERADAERQAAYWNRRHPNRPREAYKCRHCPGWHTARKLDRAPSTPATPPPRSAPPAVPSLFDA